MTLLWMDGFELYDTLADLQAVYYCGATVYPAPSATYRTGDRGIYCTNYQAGLYGAYVITPSFTPSDTVIVGVGIMPNVAPSYRDHYCIVTFQSTGTSHISLDINSSLDIDVRNASKTILGTTSGYSFTQQQWHFLECKVYIHDSAGTVEIRVNGSDTPILNLTSQDTRNGTPTTVNTVMLRGSRNYGMFFDDFYVINTSGSAPQNTWLGDCGIYPSRVTGAGNTTQLAPSAGSNYQNVDEEYGPDEDTTYNEGDALNEKDTYQMADPAAGGTIFGVKHQMTVRKTDTGAVGVTPVVRAGGTDYLGTERFLSTDYQTLMELFEDNPDDSNPWEDADINGAEAGIQITDYP